MHIILLKCLTMSENVDKFTKMEHSNLLKILSVFICCRCTESNSFVHEYGYKAGLTNTNKSKEKCQM